VTRPTGRVSRRYVDGYRDSWNEVAYLSPEDDPAVDDENYRQGRENGWLDHKRHLRDTYGGCDPDTCICNYCQGGPNGPW
jgi:hypothetical protein